MHPSTQAHYARHSCTAIFAVSKPNTIYFSLIVETINLKKLNCSPNKVDCHVGGGHRTKIEHRTKIFCSQVFVTKPLRVCTYNVGTVHQLVLCHNTLQHPLPQCVGCQTRHSDFLRRQVHCRRAMILSL